MLKPDLRLRLYAETGSSLYATVNVWPTKEAMYDHMPIERSHHGSCTETVIYQVRPGKPDRMRPQFCEVNLCRPLLGSTVLSHEMFHATMNWARRVRFDILEMFAAGSGDELEEQIAHVHSTMLSTLVNRLYAANVYDDPTE